MFAFEDNSPLAVVGGFRCWRTDLEVCRRWAIHVQTKTVSDSELVCAHLHYC